ncbi:Diacetyl reductase [(S)-acetoin forming] [Labeo rohita]|uniref:Diacetyl reductase [(S)-acetoin forming] n=1 Tax=Labeo rohita TaxID=84645 RepID=A0ABQ8LK36_LABRO|nr:Diacetyl reductase [(S)-acetoin forming] [Labeo rohita]
MVLTTITDTLHKEDKSQKVITKRGGCLQSAVSKHIKCKVDWSNRDDCKLEKTVKQSRFKQLGELHKEWNEAGVSASRVTMLRRLQVKGYQATSETEITSEASYLG